MIVSQVTINEVKKFGKNEDLGNIDDWLFEIILPSAKSFIRSYTGLSEILIDQYEDITLALLVICNEMYEKREYTVDKDKINPIAKTILDLHPRNLL